MLSYYEMANTAVQKFALAKSKSKERLWANRIRVCAQTPFLAIWINYGLSAFVVLVEAAPGNLARNRQCILGIEECHKNKERVDRENNGHKHRAECAKARSKLVPPIERQPDIPSKEVQIQALVLEAMGFDFLSFGEFFSDFRLDIVCTFCHHFICNQFNKNNVNLIIT